MSAFFCYRSTNYVIIVCLCRNRCVGSEIFDRDLYGACLVLASKLPDGGLKLGFEAKKA